MTNEEVPVRSHVEESKQSVKNSNQDNMEDFIFDIEQAADGQEELALPGIMSNMMNSFANTFVPF